MTCDFECFVLPSTSINKKQIVTVTLESRKVCLQPAEYCEGGKNTQ